MAQVPDINVVSSVGDFDPFDRDASLRGPMTNVDDYYLGEQSMWSTTDASAAEPLASPLPYSPRYHGFTTPSSEASGLEPEPFYHSPEHNTNSISSYNNSPTTPLDSLHGTPEIIPSDDRIMASISHIRTEGISRPERPEVCVDTSLLFSSQSNYPDSNNFSPGPNSSPRLLSPYDIQPPAHPQLFRRHSHTRSAGDGQDFSLVTEFTPGVDGRGRGLQRNRSAPTSRHHTPLRRLNTGLRAINNARSISPGDWEEATGDEIYHPGNDVARASPPSSTSMGREIVATERIRAASSARRLNPVICTCDVCGDGFTTNFARDRCNQKFPTDSGRKRHEKSKTLHVV
ncbi:hypothetical protein PILCRDRAFT_89697 [Piloderma croceum F 1598]|uniref:Uncharacterized protein n=1 Tax=Piloderma croceum (strain F 1598) TaxID=765440 RepID=A0A0C3FKI3_PILCF|nr:hypothetical protein PILCRDRAFT_89697 [Piloderma croceum F 1598]